MKGDTGMFVRADECMTCTTISLNELTAWQAYACITAWSLVSGTGRLSSRGLYRLL